MTAGIHKAFLEEMGFVAARVRKLPCPSRGGERLSSGVAPRWPRRGRQGMGQEERLRPQLGRGTGALLRLWVSSPHP